MTKFSKAVNEAEADNVYLSSAAGYGWSNHPGSYRFPLLDWLWVAGPSYEWQRKHLSAWMGDPGAGQAIVRRLAAFKPEWIGDWWNWRCATGQGSARDSLLSLFSNAITPLEVARHVKELTDECLVTLVHYNPSLRLGLQAERRSIIIPSLDANRVSRALDSDRYRTDCPLPVGLRPCPV